MISLFLDSAPSIFGRESALPGRLSDLRLPSATYNVVKKFHKTKFFLRNNFIVVRCLLSSLSSLALRWKSAYGT